MTVLYEGRVAIASELDDRYSVAIWEMESGPRFRCESRLNIDDEIVALDAVSTGSATHVLAVGTVKEILL